MTRLTFALTLTLPLPLPLPAENVIPRGHDAFKLGHTFAHFRRRPDAIDQLAHLRVRQLVRGDER